MRALTLALLPSWTLAFTLSLPISWLLRHTIATSGSPPNAGESKPTSMPSRSAPVTPERGSIEPFMQHETNRSLR